MSKDNDIAQVVKNIVHEVLFLKEDLKSEQDFKSALKGTIIETISTALDSLESNIKTVLDKNVDQLIYGILGIEKDRWSGKSKYSVYRTNGFVGLLQQLVTSRVEVVLTSSDVQTLIADSLRKASLKLKTQKELISQLRESYVEAFRNRLRTMIQQELANLSPTTKDDLQQDLSEMIGTILQDLVKSDEQMSKDLEFVITHVVARAI